MGFVLVAALVGFVVWSSTTLDSHRCRVCIEFKGRTQCAEAAGTNSEEAHRTAVTAACGPISGGVTDGMACSRQTPVSQKCR